MKILGIGSDVVECLRVARMIEHHGEQFIHRVFTPNEVKFCNRSPVATQQSAGRWAAKEAVLKALGTGWSKGVQWTDIEVHNESGGRPRIRLAGAARDLCERRGIGDILITISHCRTFAVAYALALRHVADEPS